MYGVLSFLPDFIQPWPKNSLYNGKHFPFRNQPSHRLLCVSVHVRRHLLIRDDLEDQVVQQCELLGYLQSRVVLKRLCLTVQHSLTHKTHTHVRQQLQYSSFLKGRSGIWKCEKGSGNLFSHHLGDFLQADLVVSRVFLSDSPAEQKIGNNCQKWKNSIQLHLLFYWSFGQSGIIK